MRTLGLVLKLAGICSLVIGVFAILNPLAATIAAVTLSAAALVATGLVQAVGAFAEPDWRSRAPSLLLAGAVLALGIVVFRRPEFGVTALTWMMAAFFFLSGAAKLGWSYTHRHDSSFWPLLVSGMLSLLLAFLTYRNVASGRSNIIGTLLGVELMLNGVALIAVAALGRRVMEKLREA